MSVTRPNTYTQITHNTIQQIDQFNHRMAMNFANEYMKLASWAIILLIISLICLKIFM